MASNFLPKFRHQLFDWLQQRLASGRLPFRRVEETPPVLTGKGVTAPDLVLWINRDSLLAGAMILVPQKTDAAILQAGCAAAGSLGLRQFVTWEARAVNLWEIGDDSPQLVKSWAMPGSRTISTDDFAVTFEQLLHALKCLAVSAVMPPEQLPPAYFANLCLQTLHDLKPSLQETARVTAKPGQSDSHTMQAARDKGWMTLWRLLTLLQLDRMPPGVRPERFDRALGYALAELNQERLRHLAPSSEEAPLPERAAVRFHYLAGRLAQLGWHQQPQRARATMDLLFAEAARDYQLDITTPGYQPAVNDLLVNHLPPIPLGGSILIAPRPCLAGWIVSNCPVDSALPAQMGTEIAALTVNLNPGRILATFVDTQPLPAPQRRKRLAALRQPWPYRRIQLAGETPAWLWDTLHLGGLANIEGTLQLTLPAAWTAAPGAELLWQLLTERWALTTLRLHGDGRQTLTLLGHDRAPDNLTIDYPDGTSQRHPLLFEDTDVATVAALAGTVGTPKVSAPRQRKHRPALGEKIAREVFRDGLPRFPEHYLRRIDLPSLRTYQLPGPLRISSHFFDRILLTGPNGATVDSANPADAEALVLASHDGRPSVDLPTDPELTMQLTAAYRDDLQRLWQTLLEECRRHHPRQRHALALARRLWRERNLPATESFGLA
jgi:hypothetical protein